MVKLRNQKLLIIELLDQRRMVFSVREYLVLIELLDQRKMVFSVQEYLVQLKITNVCAENIKE